MPTPSRSRKAGQSARRSYHHGDLREALVAAALELIDEVGARGFSMSQACRLATVSPTALYRHFTSKEALLAEVARRGFVALTAAIRGAEGIEAPHQKGQAAANLVAAGRAYVAFAKRRPAEFQAMFAAGLDKTAFPDLAAAAAEAFEQLVDRTRQAVNSGEVVGRDARAAALSAWSTAHGLAMLAIENPSRREMTASVDDVLNTIVAGLGQPPQ